MQEKGNSMVTLLKKVAIIVFLNLLLSMKVKRFYVTGILFGALTAILCLQLLWLYNMYQSYQHSLEKQLTECLQSSISQDFHQRRMQLGGTINYTLTSEEYLLKERKQAVLELEDSLITIEFNPNNLYDNQKLEQFVLKHVIPFNANQLNAIFQQNLTDRNILFVHTGIEYHDNSKDTVIYINPLNNNFKYQLYETDFISMDLIDSMKIKAYIQTPYYILFQNMLFQLFLSFLLIIAAVYCLLKLSNTIFRQRKEQEIKQGFINAMTHELKRPISSSLAMLEYVSDGISENDYSSANEFISDSVFALKKLNSYVEKIQEISKGEEGKIEFEWKEINLKPFITKLIEKYSSNKAKKIKFEIDIPQDIIFRTDILHFSNIMDNLIENSIKYSNDEVLISISIYHINSSIQIRHKDNGWGIPDSEINLIFDKFFRSNSIEKRRKSGFGLGLSYVILITNNMGGSINVKSKEKEFTEFILELPNKL